MRTPDEEAELARFRRRAAEAEPGWLPPPEERAEINEEVLRKCLGIDPEDIRPGKMTAGQRLELIALWFAGNEGEIPYEEWGSSDRAGFLPSAVALELQNRVIELTHSIYGGKLGETPEWLVRPGKAECGRRWPLIKGIYTELTGLELPKEMPPRESRRLDAVLVKRGQPSRVLEVDEKQHFNGYRATTLRAYPRSVRLAFSKRVWVERSEQKKRLEGGGFGTPRPPLFPGDGGRHRQRAFRDALADVVPLAHGWRPTLRIADFEVVEWIYGPDAKKRMRRLLAERL